MLSSIDGQSGTMFGVGDEDKDCNSRDKAALEDSKDFLKFLAILYILSTN